MRPVRLINPFPPGGSSDPSCRLLADALTKSLGQQFVVDNRGGGNGNIGTALASKATPDGYVLVFASGTTFTINPFVYTNMGFDPRKDMDPIIKFGSVPNVLVVNPALPARTLAEFTQYVKARPDELNYASAGNGSSMHLAAELYQKLSGTKMRHIPYVSPGLATQDTIANRTQLIFHLLPAVSQQALAGNVRALAVLAPTRSAVLPDVPTTKEAGMPGLEAGTWYTVLAPAGTPKSVIAMLNRADQYTALAEPVFRIKSDGHGTHCHGRHTRRRYELYRVGIETLVGSRAQCRRKSRLALAAPRWDSGKSGKLQKINRRGER